MAKLTLKDIAAKGAEMSNTLKVFDLDMFMFDWIGDSRMRFVNDLMYPDCKNSYTCELYFNGDYSKLMADVYDYEEYSAWQQRAYKAAEKGIDTDDVDSVDAKFTVDVPMERGYSDTSRRDDTGFDFLDVKCALEEAIDKHDSTGKIYPWMLRGLISADELGIEEEEFEYELNMVCGL